MSFIRSLQFFFLLFFLLLFNCLFAQTGKNGNADIIISGTILNEFTAITADITSGDQFIQVANSSLNANGRFTNDLASGDLVLIIQMQGAMIKTGVNDSTWGEITDYKNCGNYEFAVVVSVPNANTIGFICKVQNNYSVAGKTQIVRVPRLNKLSIEEILTTDKWNGSTGGVLAVECQKTIEFFSPNGAIDVAGLGFRGGDYSGIAANGGTSFVSSSASESDEKGEGIAGSQADYDIIEGRYGRGSPANGGGRRQQKQCRGRWRIERR